jgi:hypothetical protein
MAKALGSSRDSRRYCFAKIYLLANSFSHFLEPRSGIAAMNDPLQKAQPLGNIVPIPPNVILRDLGVQGKKAVHAPGFGEHVCGVAVLGNFDDNSFLHLEDVFVAKQIDPARPA